MSDRFDSIDDQRTGNAFRHTYRKLTDVEKRLVDNIKDSAAGLADLLDEGPAGREMAMARTKLEETVMWAVKAVTK